MHVGVSLRWQVSTSPVALKEVAAAAESLGFDSLWIGEHILVPADIRSRYPFSTDGLRRSTETIRPEAMVTLGFVAAVTNRIRLGTNVIPLFSRDPISLAKQAATLDVLANGRLELGIGAGWLVEEAEILGHPHDHRGQRLDEAIDIMREAWSQPSFKYSGTFYNFPEIAVQPHPPQGRDLPIWIGGTSPSAQRTTVERAGRNLMWLPQPEHVAGFATDLRAKRADVKLAASMLIDTNWQEVTATARALGHAGADHIILVDLQGDAEQTIRSLARFSEEVRPLL